MLAILGNMVICLLLLPLLFFFLQFNDESITKLYQMHLIIRHVYYLQAIFVLFGLAKFLACQVITCTNIC